MGKKVEYCKERIPYTGKLKDNKGKKHVVNTTMSCALPLKDGMCPKHG